MSTPRKAPFWKRLDVQIIIAVMAVATVLGALVYMRYGLRPESPADPKNPALVKAGAAIYAKNCAGCHGDRLQGQPDWKARLPTGRMPAPPHDDSGHTWHHPDSVLFGITKFGLVPPYGPPGYASDMTGFQGKLSDGEIWSVLAFIKSKWPAQVLQWREETLKEPGAGKNR